MQGVPLAGEGGDCGVQSRFHCAKGDFEFIRDLGVAESLEVRQEKDLTKGIREFLKGLLDGLTGFRSIKPGIRTRHADFQQIDERAGRPVPISPLGVEGGGEVKGPSATLSTEVVPRLVRGNCKKPGAKPSGCIECVGGLVNLEEGFLEDVLRTGLVVHQADEESDEVVVMTFDQRPESRELPGAVPGEERFVGKRVQRWHLGGIPLGQVEEKVIRQRRTT